MYVMCIYLITLYIRHCNNIWKDYYKNEGKSEEDPWLLNDFDLDICCQGHDPEWSSKRFYHLLLFIKKLLIKKFHELCAIFKYHMYVLQSEYLPYSFKYDKSNAWAEEELCPLPCTLTPKKKFPCTIRKHDAIWVM